MIQKSFVVSLSFIIIITATQLFCQQITTPRLSPQACIKQTIGISTIEIHYQRPGVKDRVIWGKLVPYGWSPGVPWGSKGL